MLFGEFLVNNSIITEEQLKEGLEFQKITNSFLGETLLEMAYIDRVTLLRYLELHGSSGLNNEFLEDMKINKSFRKNVSANKNIAVGK